MALTFGDGDNRQGGPLIALVNLCYGHGWGLDWNPGLLPGQSTFLKVKRPRLPEAAEVWTPALTKGYWRRVIRDTPEL